MASEKTVMGAVCPLPQPEEQCQRRCQGRLDECGALAVPHAAVQPENPALYDQEDALAQGTLFPCLNLPFHLKVNGSPVPMTPKTQLQALCFVVTELGLYLDTHPEDQEAFALFQRYTKLEERARSEYEAKYGPVTQSSTAEQKRYNWILSPWPWEVEK